MYDTTNFAEIFISERDKEILSACAFGEILSLYPSEAQHLVELGMIYEYGTQRPGWKYAITPQGQLYAEYLRKNAAELEKQQAKIVADEIAKEHREHRFQIKQTLFTIAATLLVEHFVEIVKFFYGKDAEPLFFVVNAGRTCYNQKNKAAD